MVYIKQVALFIVLFSLLNCSDKPNSRFVLISKQIAKNSYFGPFCHYDRTFPLISDEDHAKLLLDVADRGHGQWQQYILDESTSYNTHFKKNEEILRKKDIQKRALEIHNFANRYNK